MISVGLRVISAGMLRTAGLLLLLLASTSAVQREEPCSDSPLGAPSYKLCASRRRLAELQQGHQLLRSLASSAQEQPVLPPPLYDRVLDLEAAQSHGSRGPCPIDRLLVTDATPGFDSYLLMLQAGLTVARLTRRTFIVPSVVELHGRQITMRDMLDVKELKNFWHCFVEMDTLQQQAAPTSGPGVGKAPPSLAQLHLMLKKDLESGNYSRWDLQQPGDTVQGLSEWAVRDEVASRAHTLRLSGHLAPQMCGGDAVWDEAFWRHVRPSARVAEEVAAVKRQSLGQGPYAAVHLGRGLGGYCHRFVSAEYEGGQLQDAVRAMCSLNATLLAEIFASQGWGDGSAVGDGGDDSTDASSDSSGSGAGIGSSGGGGGGSAPPGGVFIATESWSERRGGPPQEELPWPGAATYRRPALAATGSVAFRHWPREIVQGLSIPEVYAPAVELFLMADAEVAVGSLASRLAVIAANIRAAYLKGTVLAWPEPAQSTWPFWECGRYHYCGEVTDTPGPLRRRSVCYPAQAW